jgi:hypothetical protein
MTITIASVAFGLIISTLIGALLHFWRGGGLGKLIYYILISWTGFWAGHIAGASLGFTFLNVGPLNLGMAILGNLVLLGFGYWLGLIRPDQKAK